MVTAADPLTLAIAATFSAEAIKPALAFWIDELDLSMRVEFAAYNQPFQELLDPSSLLSSNQHGINVVLVRLEDWLAPAPDARHGNGATANGRLDLAQEVADFVGALATAVERSRASWLLVACPVSPGANANPEQAAWFAEAEELLVARLAATPGVGMVTSAELAQAYPVPQFYDAHADSIAHVPYTPTFFAALATMLARRIYGLTQPDHKAIIVDCDNTLWTGVCGEDGPKGVEIDSGRRDIQDFLVRLHDRGVLLCLCSRNNDADVRAVFETRPEMHVALRHFAAIHSNWKPKSKNVRAIAAELGVAPEAFVFVDDDPVECADVQANCPEVLVVQLPASSAASARLLQHLWIFSRTKATPEGRQRTAFYQQTAARERARQDAPTLAEFLARLDLKVQIADATPGHVPRLSELTYRTNQFNLTTKRRSEAEIAALGQHGVESLVVRVKDRFGDYGVVGLLLFAMTAEALVADTFLLSCRALGRGVEHRMLARLGKLALERDLDRVDLPYYRTGSNRPALDFLRGIAADCEEVREAGSLFRVPARVAAEARYRPDEQALPAPLPADAVGAPRDHLRIDARAKAALLVSIAQDLSDPERVQAQIAARIGARPHARTEYVAPRTPTERKVAAILGELLGIDRVGVDDDFFEIGGHSLLAMQVLFRIRESFGVELSARTLYAGEFTAAQLAAKVLNARIQAADPSRVDVLVERLNELSDDEVRALLGDTIPVQDRGPL